ncbi:hypothetical protein QZH41_007998 [Actinostola sp. cb2023]|nr:hypothetical protein QZH41_007998 [Actinostola sp. cb2023]
MMQQKLFFLLLFGVFLFLDWNKLCFGHDVVGNHASTREDESEMTNIWAVELDTTDEEVAKRIAKLYGYEYGGKIGSLPRHFKFIRSEKDEKSLLEGEQEDDESKPSKHEFKRVLEKHPRVKWVEQQHVLVREKQREAMKF